MTDAATRSVAQPLADLLRAPGGPRDRQLLHGDVVTVVSDAEGWCRVEAQKDGYPGFLRAEALGPAISPTHRLRAAAAHVFSAPDIKSPEVAALSFGARIAAEDETGDFVQISTGFVHKAALAPADSLEPDPIAVARRFLGTPYLWGGNSRAGIDCSGLVQAALLACGAPCPGDSGQQMAEVGLPVTDATEKPGDLIFWAGHVAMVTTPGQMIHANAHHMAVVEEDIAPAVARIARTGGGPVLVRRRVAGLSSPRRG